MLATLSQFGVNSGAVWEFAAGVLVFLFVLALVLMAVGMIKNFIE